MDYGSMLLLQDLSTDVAMASPKRTPQTEQDVSGDRQPSPDCKVYLTWRTICCTRYHVSPYAKSWITWSTDFAISSNALKPFKDLSFADRVHLPTSIAALWLHLCNTRMQRDNAKIFQYRRYELLDSWQDILAKSNLTFLAGLIFSPFWT